LSFSSCCQPIREKEPCVILKGANVFFYKPKLRRKSGRRACKKIDPEMLEYLDQLLAENVPAVRKIVKNVLEEEPNPREMEKHKPLEPKPYPLRQRKTRNMRELLREFEPSP